MADFDFNSSQSILNTPPQEAGAPIFDMANSQRLNLPSEQIYIEKTGNTVEVPPGSSNTISQIWSKSLDKGDNSTNLSKLYFEQFMGNDNPVIQSEIKRFQLLTSGKIKTDGVLEEMLRASGEQIGGVLKEMVFNSAKRGAQGAVAGGTVGFSIGGIGSVPGFFGGLTAGAIAGPLETAFILETGSLFNEIRGFKDGKGNNIDINIARMGAVMGGAVSAGMEALPVGLMLRLVPGAKTAVKRLGLKATDKIGIPTNPKAFKNFLINVSTIIAAETVTEGGQELAQIAAGEIAKYISPEDFKPIRGQEVLDRVGHSMLEALKASPLIGTGFASPRLVQDLATKDKTKTATVDPKVVKLRAFDTEVVDRVTAKIKASPISDDMTTFDARLTVEDEEILADAGIQVAPDGSILAPDAELVAAESMRRTDAYSYIVSQAQTTAQREEGQVLRKVARERIRKIDKDVKALDKRIDETLETISERGAQGKTTKALDNRITALLKDREGFDKERSDLLTAEVPLEVRKQELNATDQTIEVKGVEFVKAQARKAKSIERIINRALTKGVQLAKKDVKAAQKLVIEILKNSGLAKENLGKFLSVVSNIQSAQQFERMMPRIQNRVTALLNKQRAAKATGLLKAALKRTKVKNNKGKFGPEIQDILDVARKAMAETKDSAAEKIVASDSTTNIPTPEQAFRNRILAFKADPQQTDVKIIEELLEDVVALMTLGKNIRASSVLRKKAESSAARKEFLELIGEERSNETDRQRRGRELLASLETKAFLNLSGAWWNKLARVMGSSNKTRVDAMINKLSLFAENRAFDRGTARSVERFTELAMSTGDYKSERALLKKLAKDETTNLDMGSFLHADGKYRLLDIKTRAELRKRVMELRDPTIKESLMAEQGNAYTDEIVQRLENEMTEEDARLVEAELKFYAEYYDRINETYRRTNGINLPKIEFYSPVRRRLGKEGEIQEEFLTGMISMYRGGVAPGALKSRKTNIHKVKTSGDLAVLHSHINEMEYFIAYAEKLQSLNNIVGHEEVQNRIEQVWGQDLLNTINMDLDFFSKKGVNVSVSGESLFRTLMRNFSFAQLGAKPQIGLKQLASFAAYSQDVNIKDFVEGMTIFASNPRAALKVLGKSELYAKRGMNIDQDFQALLSDRSFLNFVGKRPELAKLLMLPIKYGDKSAIALGGFAHYHAMMKQPGMTQERALKSFEVLTVRTQQSSDIDQLSELQRTSSIIRVMTQFMSSANALSRAEYSAIIERKAGRITRAEFAKRIAILHVVIPTTIQFIANGFNWDNEDQLRASIMGTLNGWFIFGDVLEAAAGFAVDGVEGVYNLETRHPLAFMTDLIKAIDDIAENGVSFEDFIEGSKAIDGVLQTGGALTGVAFKTIYNELRGLYQLAEGLVEGKSDDIKEGAALSIGYSPYTIDNKILAQ